MTSTHRLFVVLALPALLAGGCGWGDETGEGGGAAADAGVGPEPEEPRPLIATRRGFSGDPLYEWVSWAGPASFYRWEPAAFIVKNHGDAGQPRTVFARLDGDTVRTWRLLGQGPDFPLVLEVDTEGLEEGLHRFEVEVLRDDATVDRGVVDFEILFNVTAVATSPDGGLLAGTAEAGAYWFPAGVDGPPRHLPAELLDQGEEGFGRFWTYPSVDEARRASGLSVLRTVWDPDLGGFWLGTLFQGVTLYLPGDRAADDRFVRFHAPNGDLEPLPEGEEVMYTDPWWIALTALSARDSAPAVIPEPGGEGLWVASFWGLLHLHHGGTPADPADDAWTLVGGHGGDDDGLTDLHLAAAARDADGRLWLGTFDFEPEGTPALFVLEPGDPRSTDDDRWRSYGAEEGLEADRILSLAVAPDGVVWAGTDDGLYRLDPGDDPMAGPPLSLRRYGAADGLRDEDVLALLPEAEGGGVWFGTADVCSGDGGGLHRLRPGADGAADVLVLTREDGLLDDDVSSLAFADGGGLWVGSFNLLAAPVLNLVAGSPLPECDGGPRPDQARIGRDGLSLVREEAVGFSVLNL